MVCPFKTRIANRATLGKYYEINNFLWNNSGQNAYHCCLKLLKVILQDRLTRSALNFEKFLLCHNCNPYKYTNVPYKRDLAERGLVFLKYGVFDFIIIYLFIYLFFFLDPK